MALGGLNHQIEHHLVPSMPSPNLRKARVLVRHFCEELGADYLETGLIASYRQALTALHQAGAPLRHHRISAHGWCRVVDAPSTSAAVAPAFAGAARRDGESGDTVAVLRQIRRRRGEGEELLETAQVLLDPQTGSFTSEVGARLEYVGSTHQGEGIHHVMLYIARLHNLSLAGRQKPSWSTGMA